MDSFNELVFLWASNTREFRPPDTEYISTLFGKHGKFTKDAVQSLRRMGANIFDAEEICQNAQIHLVGNIRKGNLFFEQVNSLWGYYHRICKNMWYTQSNSSSAAKHFLSLNADNISDMSSEEYLHLVDFDDDFERTVGKLVTRIIEELSPPNYREVITLFYFGGFTYSEIKKIMGFNSIKAVQNCRFRAIQKIREKLSEISDII